MRLANIHPSWYLYHPQLMKSWSDARYSSAVKNCKVAGKVAADLLNWLVQQQLVGWSDVGKCCWKHNFFDDDSVNDIQSSWDEIHIIGSSLGGHAAGYAGRFCNQLPYRWLFLVSWLKNQQKKKNKTSFHPRHHFEQCKNLTQELIFSEHCSGSQALTQVVLCSTVWREKTAWTRENFFFFYHF